MSGKKSNSPPQGPAKPRQQAQDASKQKKATAGAGKTESEEKGNHGSGDYSVNALSKLLGYDRRTIDKAIVGLDPTRVEGKTKFYKIADVENAIRAKKSDKLRDQKMLQEIRKLRIANDKEEGLVVAKGKVIDSIRRCLSPAVATLEQRLVNEYPTAVAGMDVPQARIYGRRLCDELIAFFKSLEKEWSL
jgi:hypothetical protein